MTYDRQILQVLTDVGEKGISARLLARHVYNMNLSLFHTPDLNEIYSYVRQYLLKNSKSPQSLIEHTEQRGCYRLNTRNNDDARQLMLQFHDEQQGGEEPEVPVAKDYSLDLFG